MHKLAAVLGLAALLLAAPAAPAARADFTGGSGPLVAGASSTGDLSAATVTPTNGGTARSLASMAADVINLKNMGAKGNGIWVVPNPGDTVDPVYGATMAAGSCVLTTTHGPFNASMVGEDIAVNGAGPSGGWLVTTVASYQSANQVTLAACASTAVPVYRISNVNVGTGVVTSSYQPGQTVTFGSGTFTTAGVGTIESTTPANATVNAAGSGGTANATCTLTGTIGSGTPTNGVFTVTLGVTLTAAGGISTINSVTGSQFSVSPTLTSGYVTVSLSNSAGCGSITGAAANLFMGPDYTAATTEGAYSVFPTGQITPSATSGSGAGATFTIKPNANGEFLVGTDDTAAIAAAVAQVNSDAALGISDVIVAPPGTYAIFGTTLTQFARYVPGAVVGTGSPGQTKFVAPLLGGSVFSTSDAWAVNTWPVNANSRSGWASPGIAPFGPTFQNFTIVCDRADPNAPLDGIDLYDHTDEFVIDEVRIFGCPGHAAGIASQTKNASAAYARESFIGNVKFLNDGYTGRPVVELGSVGSTGSNNIMMGNMNIYAPTGAQGLVIHGGANVIKGFGIIRVEGLEQNPNDTQFDLADIGDTTDTSGPNAYVVLGLNFVLINPYFGAYGLGVLAANSASQSYDVHVTLMCMGGADYGGCVNIAAGRVNTYRIDAMPTGGGYGLTVGPTPGAGGEVGGDNLITGIGLAGATMNIAPSADGSIYSQTLCSWTSCTFP